MVHIQGSQGKIHCRGWQGLPIPWKDTRLAFWSLDSAMEQKSLVSGPPRSLRSQWLRDPYPGWSPWCPLQARLIVLDTVLSPPKHTVSCGPGLQIAAVARWLRDQGFLVTVPEMGRGQPDGRCRHLLGAARTAMAPK